MEKQFLLPRLLSVIIYDIPVPEGIPPELRPIALTVNIDKDHDRVTHLLYEAVKEGLIHGEPRMQLLAGVIITVVESIKDDFPELAAQIRKLNIERLKKP